jgi:hypothetical protein
VCPRLVPGARRGHPQQVDPQLRAGERDLGQFGGKESPDLVPAKVGREQGDEPGLRERPGGEVAPHSGSDGGHVQSCRPLLRAQPVHPARGPHRLGERGVVGGRDHVDRAAHDPALDDRGAMQCGGEVGAAEPGRSGPQPDVARRRVLGLQPAHRRERQVGRQVRALEQELAGEQCPVQLPRRQHPLAHRRSLPRARTTLRARRHEVVRECHVRDPRVATPGRTKHPSRHTPPARIGGSHAAA